MFLRKGKRIAMKDYSFEEPFEKYPLAMAYVPWQHFTQMYENLEKGYKAGTLNKNGQGGIMKAQMAKFSEEDIAAINAYIDSL